MLSSHYREVYVVSTFYMEKKGTDKLFNVVDVVLTMFTHKFEKLVPHSIEKN